MGEMSRTRLMQVTRAVEKEIQGKSGSGSNHNRGSRYTNGPQRSGSNGFNRNGSDWVMVRNKESGGNRGVKSGSSGLRGDRQAQGDRKRNGPRDRG
ncbi:hypothetical protein A2U01_0044563, partial [Trifolium medium]|nr:hypothetical protein [Trifolium medium]